MEQLFHNTYVQPTRLLLLPLQSPFPYSREGFKNQSNPFPHRDDTSGFRSRCGSFQGCAALPAALS